jgi:hypothetical protein
MWQALAGRCPFEVMELMFEVRTPTCLHMQVVSSSQK